MPVFRQAARSRGFWLKWIAAIVLVAAVIFDWTRPPQNQLSVAAYDRVVLGGYRTFVRPMSSKIVRCRFRPTCSAYSSAAVQNHGLPRGGWLTLKRLVRCAPWTPVGTDDPVPPRP